MALFKVKRMNWNAEKVQAEVSSGSKKALTDTAEFILEEANRTVPHDEGNLQRSGGVDYDDKKAAVYYESPYAIRLHEHPEYNFQKGRRGKWLELTFQEQRRQIADRLGNNLKGLFR